MQRKVGMMAALSQKGMVALATSKRRVVTEQKNKYS